MVAANLDRKATFADPAVFRSAALCWALLVLALLALFHETAGSMVRIWSNSASYGHGFLVPLIAAYLVWIRLDRLRDAVPTVSAWGALMLLGAAAVWVVGFLAGVNVLQHFGLVGMIQGTAVAVFGLRIAWILAMPLGYLLLAVPFGDFAVQPLQDLTAVYTTELLRLSGLPVYLENWRIVIPGGAFLVAEACAGVRYLLACIALGLLICDLMLRTWWKYALFLVLSVVVPIVANVFRAYGIVMLAHLSDFTIAVDVDHLIYGWIFLSFVTLMLIGLALLLRDPDRRTSAERSESRLAVDADGASPKRSGRFGLAAGGILAMLMTVRLYGAWAASPGDLAMQGLDAPSTVGAWTRVANVAADWRGRFHGADAEGAWVYRRGPDKVTLYAAYYTHERPGAELISFQNSLDGGESFQVEGRGRLDAAPAPGVVEPATLVLRSAGSTSARHVWYWYWAGESMMAHAGAAKLALLKSKILGGSPAAGVVALSTASGEDAASILKDFIADADLAGLLASAGSN